MVYYLFLDDLRYPHTTTHVSLPMHSYTVVRSYKEFCDIITLRGLPKYVTFDHDLSDTHYQHIDGDIPYEQFTEKTGYDCAKWLVDYCVERDLPLPDYHCHSMNPVGKINILSILDSYRRMYKIKQYGR